MGADRSSLSWPPDQASLLKYTLAAAVMEPSLLVFLLLCLFFRLFSLKLHPDHRVSAEGFSFSHSTRSLWAVMSTLEIQIPSSAYQWDPNTFLQAKFPFDLLIKPAHDLNSSFHHLFISFPLFLISLHCFKLNYSDKNTSGYLIPSWP